MTLAINYNLVNKRQNAEELLGDIGDADSIRPLITNLQDSSENKASLTRKLGFLLVSKRSSKVRCFAASVLGEMGGSEAENHLIRILKDDTEVRQCAGRSLELIGEPAVGFLINSIDGENAEMISKILVNIGEPAIYPLGKILEDKIYDDPSLEDMFIIIVSTLEKILFNLKSKDPEEFEQKQGRIIDLLISEFNKKYSTEVICKFAQALGNIGTIYAIESLIKAINDEEIDQNIRICAIEAHIKIGNNFDELIKALRNISLGETNVYLINKSIYALITIGTDGAVKVLEELYYSNTKILDPLARSKIKELLGKNLKKSDNLQSSNKMANI